MINSWKGKDKLPKGSISYIDKITKGPSPKIYHHWLFYFYNIIINAFSIIWGW